MILDVTHVALTVEDKDRSVAFYERLGLTKTSDAERSGPRYERITGIKGFHTRTVYMGLNSYQHIELFHFYHPPAIRSEIRETPEEGPVCVRIDNSHSDETGRLHNSRPVLQKLIGPPEPAQADVVDPNNVWFRLSSRGPDDPDPALRWPVLATSRLDEWLEFYQGALGLSPAEPTGKVPDNGGRRMTLAGKLGPCLQIVQPKESDPLPAPPWRMERIGCTHIAFLVTNLEEYARELKEKGVRFTSEVQPLSLGPHAGGKLVYLYAPGEFRLEFIESPLSERI